MLSYIFENKFYTLIKYLSILKKQLKKDLHPPKGFNQIKYWNIFFTTNMYTCTKDIESLKKRK